MIVRLLLNELSFTVLILLIQTKSSLKLKIKNMSVKIPSNISKWMDVGVSVAAAAVIYGALQKYCTLLGGYVVKNWVIN